MKVKNVEKLIDIKKYDIYFKGIRTRNFNIYQDFSNGLDMHELIDKYNLSIERLRQIIRRIYMDLIDLKNKGL